MLFLINFYRESTWEDIDEDEFGDEWGEQRGRRSLALFKIPTAHRQ